METIMHEYSRWETLADYLNSGPHHRIAGIIYDELEFWYNACSDDLIEIELRLEDAEIVKRTAAEILENPVD